jgi:hypothetical protein
VRIRVPGSQDARLAGRELTLVPGLPSSYVCFSVLLNLAEDIHTERKMVKRKVVLFLTKVCVHVLFGPATSMPC